ncbi:MAG: hypothetical protein ACI9DH_001603, partial [Halioglobus sp.]
TPYRSSELESRRPGQSRLEVYGTTLTPFDAL